jgi:hypothetical protein
MLMDQWATGVLVERAAGKDDEEVQAELRRELRDLAAELAGPSPTPAETK